MSSDTVKIALCRAVRMEFHCKLRSPCNKNFLEPGNAATDWALPRQNVNVNDQHLMEYRRCRIVFCCLCTFCQNDH